MLALSAVRIPDMPAAVAVVRSPDMPAAVVRIPDRPAAEAVVAAARSLGTLVVVGQDREAAVECDRKMHGGHTGRVRLHAATDMTAEPAGIRAAELVAVAAGIGTAVGLGKLELCTLQPG